jgi:hypothetical protein
MSIISREYMQLDFGGSEDKANAWVARFPHGPPVQVRYSPKKVACMRVATEVRDLSLTLEFSACRSISQAKTNPGLVHNCTFFDAMDW